MSPSVELVLGLAGGGAALVTIVTAIAKGVQWALTRLVREELNPTVNKMTAQFAAMKASFDSAQANAAKGSQELHDAVLELRDTVELMSGRVGDVETDMEVLKERVNTLQKEKGVA